MATKARFTARSGSLSSGSESSGSDSEGDSGKGRVKSAIVLASLTKRKYSSSSPVERRKYHTLSESPPTSRKHSRSPPAYRRQRSPSSSPEGRRRERSPPRRRRKREAYSASPLVGHRRRSLSRTPSPRPKPQKWEDDRDEAPPPKRKKEELDPILTRTGGAYIPPARLRMMQQQITDKSSLAYQRLSWEALKKSINGLINKVNVSNIGHIVQELFQENIVRGRGLLARSIIQAQAASPTFTHVYAALVSIVNTKFPQTGELIAKRLMLQFRKGFRRNSKNICVTAVKFVAHLVNQQVLHELVALELLTLLLEEPTDDSVEVSVGFLKECGQKLTEVTPRGVHAVFETLRSILHSGKITSRVQYMIEVMFAIRKDKFKDHPAVLPDLDLVQEEDQITHLLSLGDEFEANEALNVFHHDPDFVANEEKYQAIKAEILGEGDSGSESGEASEDEGDSDEEEEESKVLDITDKTDAVVLSLRRTIYLTIMSSLDFEECAHKLLKNMEAGHEREIANMLIECCSQERSYLRFYGLLGQRFCQLNQAWVEQFDAAFQETYATVHRLETNKLRNVAKFFAQLFYADALPWTCMSCIHLNEEETNSSSRIFVKILYQELAEFMGMPKLNNRLRDPLLALAFEGLLPRDNPKNTRFAINFFTSIGLGGLTDDLREHLMNAQKLIMAQKQEVSSSDTSSSSDSSEESSSESSSGSSESESSSEEEEKEDERQRRHRKQNDKGRREKEKEKEREKEREKEKEKEREREKAKQQKEEVERAERQDKEREKERRRGREKERPDERRRERSRSQERRRKEERHRDHDRDRDRDRDHDRDWDRERDHDRDHDRERDRDRDHDRDWDRERDHDRDHDRDWDRDRDHIRDRDRDHDRDRDRDRDHDRDRDRDRDHDRDRDRDRDHDRDKGHIRDRDRDHDRSRKMDERRR